MSLQLPLSRSKRSAKISCWVAVLFLGFTSQWGCNSSTAPPSLPTSPTAKVSAGKVSAGKVSSGPSAKHLLEKMRNVYQDATSYADNASVVFRAVVRTKGSEQETVFTQTSVAFERPNKLHVTYKKYISSPQEESYEIVSNGSFVRSSANEVPTQIHEAIAPCELSAENFSPEPALREAILQNAIENTLPQLALLLRKRDEQGIFFGEDQARKLSEAELGNKFYHRVELPSPVGKRVLWIDKDRFTLHRMEIPVDDQKELIDPSNRYSRISLWIDFEDVTIDAEIETETFVLAVPENARRVRRFVPPPPAGPPEYFGKPVNEFSFQTLDGEIVTPNTHAGKVTVLDFWATNCPPCKVHTPVLNQVYQHFQDSGEVAFLAVSGDTRAVPNQVVAKTMLSWGGEMPVVRDLASSGFHHLRVQQYPTLVLIDREGRLQAFEVGVHQRPEPLVDVIQRLVDGENIAAADRDKHAGYVAQFEQALDDATIEDSIVEVEIASPEVPPRRLPVKIQLNQLWQTTASQLQLPGDILVAENTQPETFRLFVIDGGIAIVELDDAGKSVGRHELPQHNEKTGGFLRRWRNRDGQSWTVASGVGWQRVFVYDDKWQEILSFPDEQHSGIGDVLFEDLTDSDVPVIFVGYWGGRGVQGGTLDGRRLWSNRRLDHVVQLGVGPPAATAKDSTASTARTTWCTSTRGTLMQLRADGKTIQERYVEGQSLMFFASQPDGTNYCGLSRGKVGEYTAVGFAATGAPDWEYPLPPGQYVEQLPRVQCVQLASGQDGWLIAAANGSLHWLSETGELIDRFDYGEILTGVAVRSQGDQTLLLVATAEHLTAWQVTSPPELPAEESNESSESLESTQTDPNESVED